MPICGYGDPESLTSKLFKTPFWIFHGLDDDIVPVEDSQVMVEALQNLGHPDFRYTEFPGVDHLSWDFVYPNQAYANWMMSKIRR
jgi:predicted peptidase